MAAGARSFCSCLQTRLYGHDQKIDDVEQAVKEVLAAATSKLDDAGVEYSCVGGENKLHVFSWKAGNSKYVARRSFLAATVGSGQQFTFRTDSLPARRTSGRMSTLPSLLRRRIRMRCVNLRCSSLTSLSTDRKRMRVRVRPAVCGRSAAPGSIVLARPAAILGRRP